VEIRTPQDFVTQIQPDQTSAVKIGIDEGLSKREVSA
jgi:hypothetical protein